MAFGKKKNSTELAAPVPQASPVPNGKGNAKGKAVVSKKVMATTVQEVIDFKGITPEGIVFSGKDCYSKLYSLTDANFVTEPEAKQVDTLVNFTRFVNRFPDKIDISIIIVNRRNTVAELANSYHLKSQGDALDVYREDYNKIIDAKIEEGHNDISKLKYIMLTVHAKSLREAESEFTAADVSLQETIKAINKVGVRQLNAIERMSFMKEILCGVEGIPFEKEFDRFIDTTYDEDGNERKTLNLQSFKKAGVSIKDPISPQIIARSNTHLQLDEGRLCKSYAYANLPQSLDTIFLTNSTNLPYEMVTVIQLKSVPRKTALRQVKMMNTSIKADVIKASQQAFKSGYDPSLMNEDLAHAQEEAVKLREDVVQGGKKLFYATMVVTVFAKDEEELKNIEGQYKSICQDFTVTPSFLLGQQLQALNTAICVGTSKVIIDRMITSDNACALFPFNIQELQDKRGHFYGVNAISKNMAMYDRKRSRLANGLIFGQSGSGKSFFTKGEIIPNLLDGKDDMVILDPENEYRVIANKFGGTVIDLETNSDYHINPCDMSMEWNDERAAPLVEKCDYMVGLVESILGRGRECNSYEVNVIHRACNKMYEPYMEEMKKRHRNGDNRDIDTTIMPTLQDFYQELLNDSTPEGNKIAMAIEPYCVGNYSLFAHRTNVQSDSRLTVFNLLYLPDKMKEMAMKVCLANIWTRIVKNKEENEKFHTGKSIWVYLDEFHLFFQTESSANTIMAYFKRVRKYGGIMTGITQDVADLLKTQQGTAMFNNTGFFVFLNQSPIGRNQLQNLYNISDALIDYIKDKPSGMGLIYNNSILIPMDYKLPNTSELYKIMSTNPNDEVKKKPQKEDENPVRTRAERNSTDDEDDDPFANADELYGKL